MRTKVGVLGAALIVGSLLATGTPASGGTEAPDAPPAATAAPDDTLSGAPANSTGDIAINGPASADGQLPPRSGNEQVRVAPLPPPPSTLPPIPPEWIVPANSGTGRRAVYSKTMQRVWAVDSSGKMIKTHLVSGKQAPLDPRPGTYHVWSRSLHTFSVNNPSIVWKYMVRFAKGSDGGNIGFHEIPTQYGRPLQSIWQLGQPLSAGCVRQAPSDALWMWNWAQLGTKVVVLP
jgi:hypothetical protein